MMQQQPFHFMPLTGDEPDIAHAPTARLTRSRANDECPLCVSGRCWQSVSMTTRGETVLHGVSVQ